MTRSAGPVVRARTHNVIIDHDEFAVNLVDHLHRHLVLGKCFTAPFEASRFLGIRLITVSGIEAMVGIDRNGNATGSCLLQCCQYSGFIQASVRDPGRDYICLLYTSPSPRDLSTSRMPSSA